jgi:hypothetical protein
MPVIGASYSPFFFRLFYRFTFSFLRIWGFLFSNSFFNYLSQDEQSSSPMPTPS